MLETGMGIQSDAGEEADTQQNPTIWLILGEGILQEQWQSQQNCEREQRPYIRSKSTYFAVWSWELAFTSLK